MFLLCKQNAIIWIAGCFCVLLSLNSCQKQKDDPSQNPVKKFEFGKKCNLQVSYEVEHLSFEQFPDSKAGNKTEFLEQTRKIPIVDRQEVKIKIFEDGNSEYFIKKMDPTILLPSRKGPNILPDNTPRTELTRISGNVAYFYDKNGALLNQYTMPSNFMNSITERLRSPQANLITIALMQNGEINVEKLLTEAQKQGATITKLSNGIITIRYETGSSSGNTVPSKTSAGTNLITVNMYDSRSNLLMGSRVYDQKQTLLMQSYCKYKKANGKIDLEMIYSEDFSVNAEGKKVKTISNIYFRNLQVVQNP